MTKPIASPMMKSKRISALMPRRPSDCIVIKASGVDNLAHSWDIVTWWAVFAFLHMDQVPVPNEL